MSERVDSQARSDDLDRIEAELERIGAEGDRIRAEVFGTTTDPTTGEADVASEREPTAPTVQERRYVIGLAAMHQDLSWMDGVTSDPVGLLLGCICAELAAQGCEAIELAEEVATQGVGLSATMAFLNGASGLSAPSFDGDDEDLRKIRRTFYRHGAAIRKGAGLGAPASGNDKTAA